MFAALFDVRIQNFTNRFRRENKNRYLFSFLSVLLELRIFEEITFDYLIVGHTGNEVDQLFRYQ